MKTFSGICICGHSWDDHHHGIILNPQYLIDNNLEYKNVNGVLGEECEHDIFEGYSEVDNPCTCNSYYDKNWPNEN